MRNLWNPVICAQRLTGHKHGFDTISKSDALGICLACFINNKYDFPKTAIDCLSSSIARSNAGGGGGSMSILWRLFRYIYVLALSIATRSPNFRGLDSPIEKHSRIAHPSHYTFRHTIDFTTTWHDTATNHCFRCCRSNQKYLLENLMARLLSLSIVPDRRAQNVWQNHVAPVITTCSIYIFNSYYFAPNIRLTPISCVGGSAHVFINLPITSQSVRLAIDMDVSCWQLPKKTCSRFDPINFHQNPQGNWHLWSLLLLILTQRLIFRNWIRYKLWKRGGAQRDATMMLLAMILAIVWKLSDIAFRGKNNCSRFRPARSLWRMRQSMRVEASGTNPRIAQREVNSGQLRRNSSRYYHRISTRLLDRALEVRFEGVKRSCALLESIEWSDFVPVNSHQSHWYSRPVPQRSVNQSNGLKTCAGIVVSSQLRQCGPNSILLQRTTS